MPEDERGQSPAQPEQHHSGDEERSGNAIASAEMYEGMLPHPRILEGFEEVLPGSAERLMAMAEGQMGHRHKLEDRGQEMQYDLEKHGLDNDIEETRELSKTARRMTYATLLLLSWVASIVLGVFAFLVYIDEDIQAIAILLGGILTLIGSALGLLRRMSKRLKEVQERKEELEQERKEAAKAEAEQ